MTLLKEIRRTIYEYTEHAKTLQTLSHHQRRDLFWAVITGLSEFVRPPMLEKTIHCLTIHVMAQAIVDMNLATSNTTGTVHMLIEPCEQSKIRGSYEVPIWLVSGMKLYYLDVRSHFLPDEGTGKFTRRFADRGDHVLTEVLFVNSAGKKDFRARAIVDQVKTVVSKMSINI